ncbi:ribonuclease H-like domain-containing protein [Tanacetum coccineum]
MPPKLDLSFSGLEEFVNEPIVSEPTVKKPLAENSKAKISEEKPKAVRKNNGALIIEEWVFDSGEEDVPQAKIEKKTIKFNFAKIEFVKSKKQVKSPKKTTVKEGDQNKLNTHSTRGNQRNWNYMMSQRLWSNFEMINKACYVCGSFDHLQLKAVVNAARPKAIVNAVKGNHVNDVKASAYWVWKPKTKIQEKGVIDSGCSRHMTGNMSYPIDFEEIDGGYVAFRGNPKGGKITGRGTIKTGNLDFENVYFVRELKFNLFNVSQMCDKKNSVLFNDTECIVLSPNFKLTDESHVLLKVPRKNNMYSVDLKNIVPKGGLTCLFAKATSDESKLWHRGLGHLNFKTMNKLVKGNLVRGLPSKLFKNDQSCVACHKGKQHKASCKSKTENSISLPLHMLHMDLFGPTFVKSLMKKMYCLVVTNDYSRFTWVFFLATKDETSGILKSFITGIENLVDHKVKVIRYDNGTEFKNKEMNQFCEIKGILRQFSVARTPQQNGVAERRNKTLIEAARTMLADSKLPTTFWAEAVNTACYVQNKVLVVKPHNKTPYELFHGRTPTLSFMRPFGCPVTILNTIDHLGKFNGKADEGFFVGYSLNSKAFRVFNSRTRIVEENLHIRFRENTLNVVGSGPDWLFDIDALTRTMNYEPIVADTQSNSFAGTKASVNAGQARKEKAPVKDYILLLLWTADPLFSKDPKSYQDDRSKPSSDDGKKVDDDSREESESNDQEKDDDVNSTNNVNAASTNEVNAAGDDLSIELQDDPNMPALEDISVNDFSSDDEDVGIEADLNNLDTSIQVSPIPTTRIHKDHPLDQVIGYLQTATQTRRMSKNLEEHGFVSTIQQRTNHKDLQNCLFACFLSQEEPKKVIQALKDPSWIEAMQEELLQFKLQEVWTLVDLPNGKRAIGTKWVYRNKKDDRGIVIRNKARLVAQGHTQEEGIDYDEVFAPVARIEAIRLFLAYASFKDFVVYQMDVKSAFLYGKIEEEVYVCQPPRFEDPDFPDRVYKVEKALYRLHQAPRAWYETLSTYLLDNRFQRGKIDKTLFIKRLKGDILLVQVYVDDIIFGSTKKELCTAFEKLMHEKFQMSSMGELTFFLGLQVKQKKDGIFISQDKYVAKILKKFGFTDVKTASTPMETQKPLLKDEDGEEVDVHMYRSMIGSLMYLTSSRPDIMFAVCACARYQVNPKISHLHAVKRIFRYLKGQPKLGLWYPKDSPFDLVSYTDSDYARASLDRKSTTGGCQFLGCRLISWQCKKQTMVANSTTEAEYVAASSCCGQVLWIQNQLLDYSEGFEQIFDFLNAHQIKYALTVNPTIYVSFIEQFWTTGVVKKMNGEAQIHALVDGKKVIVSEATVRMELQLVDEEGVDCLPNSTIFEELTRMGAKTTAWNEFSSTMASAIICLATNQKFNFSKFIFECMLRNLDNTSAKILMYPRFVQLFVNQQVEGMPTHKRKYIAPCHTKKVFGNMKRIDKDFSGNVTPLFPTMVVQNQPQPSTITQTPTTSTQSPTTIQPTTSIQPSQPQKQKIRKPRRKVTEVPQPSEPSHVADGAVNEEMDDRLVRAATTASSLKAEQDSGNINKTRSKATPNEPGSQRTSSGGGPRVLDLEKTKTSQQIRIESLERKVKKLEKKDKKRTHKLKRLYKVGLSRRVESYKDEGLGEEDASKQGRIADIDAAKDIYLVNVHRDEDMFGVNDLDGDELIVDAAKVSAAGIQVSVADAVKTVSAAQPITTADVKEDTLAQALQKIKSTTPKSKGVVIQEREQSISKRTQTPQQIQGKGKAKMIEPEKPLKIKDQISFDKQEAKRLQAELQAEEQEELTDAEKTRLFVQLLETRRKHFAAKRAEEKRNKPPTQAQQRRIMSMKRVNTFVDYRAELEEENLKKAEVKVIEGSSKRAGDELEQESTKKQKMDDVNETAELKSMMKVISDEEEVAVDAIPLATKPPTIVDYKIHKEGKRSYYQITRADGSSKMYLVFSQLLKSFDREDLETLWRLVKAKHRYTRPEEGYERVLWGDLKVMFEPHVEDAVWRNLRENKVLIWKLFDSCGVHFVRFESLHIYMLVEKKYPLTPATITDMLNKKLQADHWNEMCYQLLKLITKQLKNQ